MSVFVGIPTLNRPDYVREAIDSALGQTFEGLRVVVSDNDSEPAARESVARFVRDRDDRRLVFHQQSENVGEYGQARFFLGAAADAEFFVILHDDDVLDPACLETAVECLRRHPEVAAFAATPYIMDEGGRRLGDKTAWYRSAKRCDRRSDGPFDLLTTLLRFGFPRICGTCFRTSALRDSGFLDADCSGNYPFEFNLLLRLGDTGARGWFCRRELLGFRFHGGSMMNYIQLLENPDVVLTMIRLLERRRFTGANERRRRMILGRLHRASAVMRAKRGDVSGCRRATSRALKANPRSIRSWAFAPLGFLAPNLVRAALPEPPEVRFGPRCDADRGYRPRAASDA